MPKVTFEIPPEEAARWACAFLTDNAIDFAPTVFTGFARINGARDVGAHAWVLYGLVRTTRPQTIVEIGTWCGYSTCWLAQGAKDNGFGHVWSIDDASFDPAQTPAAAEGHLARFGLSDWVTLVTAKSPDCFTDGIMPQEIDLAFIDGAHNYAGCKADAEAVLARLRPDGVMLFHDTRQWEGVSQYWQEFREASNGRFDFVELPYHAGLGLALPHYRDGSDFPFTEAEHPGGSVPPLSTKS